MRCSRWMPAAAPPAKLAPGRHLAMSAVAQKQDVTDPDVVADYCKNAQMRGLKVIIGRGECQLERQRRVKPQTAARLKAGGRVETPRFGVDPDVCTGDKSCMRLNGCPSLTLKDSGDPLRDDPVAHVDGSCVGCGLCGEVAHAAVLCPSFYRADIIINPTGWDRAVARMRAAVIGERDIGVAVRIVGPQLYYLRECVDGRQQPLRQQQAEHTAEHGGTHDVQRRHPRRLARSARGCGAGSTTWCDRRRCRGPARSGCRWCPRLGSGSTRPRPAGSARRPGACRGRRRSGSRDRLGPTRSARRRPRPARPDFEGDDRQQGQQPRRSLGEKREAEGRAQADDDGLIGVNSAVLAPLPFSFATSAAITLPATT